MIPAAARKATQGRRHTAGRQCALRKLRKKTLANFARSAFGLRCVVAPLSDFPQVTLLPPLRFNLDIDCHCLADARDRFSRWRKHQIEVTPRDRIGCHRPAGPCSFINRCQQFHMKRNRLGHAMHCQVTENVATLRAGAFYAPALKRDLGKFLDIKKFWAAQMIVALFDLRIDAPHADLRSYRRLLRMFSLDFDPAVEARELAASRAKELMHTEPNGGAGWIEPIALSCHRGGSESNHQQRCDTNVETARPRAAPETRRGRRDSKRNRPRNRIHASLFSCRGLLRLRRECFQERSARKRQPSEQIPKSKRRIGFQSCLIVHTGDTRQLSLEMCDRARRRIVCIEITESPAKQPE